MSDFDIHGEIETRLAEALARLERERTEREAVDAAAIDENQRRLSVQIERDLRFKRLNGIFHGFLSGVAIELTDREIPKDLQPKYSDSRDIRLSGENYGWVLGPIRMIGSWSLLGPFRTEQYTKSPGGIALLDNGELISWGATDSEIPFNPITAVLQHARNGYDGSSIQEVEAAQGYVIEWVAEKIFTAGQQRD